jgi:hypothetical protein
MVLRFARLVVHETSDPGIVVTEWDYDGLVTTTGRSFRVSNITVIKVRSGKIVASRDYHNHAVLASATGRLPTVMEAMSKGQCRLNLPGSRCRTGRRRRSDRRSPELGNVLRPNLNYVILRRYAFAARRAVAADPMCFSTMLTETCIWRAISA